MATGVKKRTKRPGGGRATLTPRTATPAPQKDRPGYVRGRPKMSPKTRQFYTNWLPIQTSAKEIQKHIRLKLYRETHNRNDMVYFYREIKRWVAIAKANWHKDFTASTEAQRASVHWSSAVAHIRNLRSDLKHVYLPTYTVSKYNQYAGGKTPWITSEVRRMSIQAERFTRGLADVNALLRSSKLRFNSRVNDNLEPDSLYASMGMSRKPTVKGVHLEPSWFLKQQHKRVQRVVMAAKTPGDPEINYVGVELEFFAPFSLNVITGAIAKVGLHRHVNPTTDQSIREVPDGNIGTELRIIASEKDIFDVIRRTCALLRELNAGVNKTCGLHVHLDMRNRKVEAAYTKMHLALDLLLALVPLPRRTNLRYCDINKAPDFRTDLADDCRYRAINTTSFTKHGTLEVRLHQGSTNATKINAWIAVLLSIVNGPTLKRLPRSTATMAKVWKWAEDLHRYVNSRILHFSYPEDKRVFKVKGPGDLRESQAIYEKGEDREIGNQDRPPPARPRAAPATPIVEHTAPHPTGRTMGIDGDGWPAEYDRAEVVPVVGRIAMLNCACRDCTNIRQRVRDLGPLSWYVAPAGQIYQG